MELNIVKKIPIGIDATSVAVTDNHVVTTTGQDDFCVVADLGQSGKNALSAQKFTAPAGREQVLFSGKNTVVALMNGRTEAVSSYSGLEMTMAFGSRQINGAAVSNDGEKVAFFLEDLPLPALDQKYFAQVDNVYVIELANVMVPGLEVGSGLNLDLGLLQADIAGLGHAGAVTTMRPVMYEDAPPYYEALAGAFISGSGNVFILAFDAAKELLVCFVFTAEGEPIEMGYFDAVTNMGMNNRCCVAGNVAYAISNKGQVIYAYDLDSYSEYSILVRDKQILDIAVFKEQLFALVWNTQTTLYELLDQQLNVVASDSSYAALAVSEQYLIVPSGNSVYLYQ